MNAKNFLVIAIYFLIGNLSAQEGEIHYQAYAHRHSKWQPINDSLTVAFSPKYSSYLGSMVKVSFVTGKWKAKGSRVLKNRYSHSDFAELKSGRAIGIDYPGSSFGMQISNGFNAVLKDTVALDWNVFASDSCFLVRNNWSSSAPIKYSEDGIVWYNSTMDQSTYISFSIEDIAGQRVLTGGNRIAHSYDGGKSFQTIPYNKMPFLPLNAQDLVLVGDSGIYVRGLQGAYTEDFGDNWLYSPSPSNVSQIKLIRGDSLIGLPVTGNDTIKLSTDAGATWMPWLTATPGNSPIIEVFTYGDALFFVDEKEVVWRTEDNGVNFDIFLHPSVSHLIDPNSEWRKIKARDSIVVALGDSGSMIVSTNYGNTFEIRDKQAYHWYDYTILSSQKILATCNTGTYLSLDLGKSWSNVISAFSVDHSFSSDSTEQIIALGSWVSTDGGNSFNQIGNGMFKPDLTVLPSGRLLNIVDGGTYYWVREYGLQGNFTTIDSAYGPVQSRRLEQVDMLSDSQGWAFVNTYYDLEVYWTADGWQTRRLMSTFNVPSNFPYQVGDIHVYSPTELFFAQGNDEKLLFHSVDSGKTWSVADSLPFASFTWYQKYTSGTFRDTNSWWVTNENYFIRRNPRNWDSKSLITSGLNIGSYDMLKRYNVYPNPTNGNVRLPESFTGEVIVINNDGQFVDVIFATHNRINLEKYPNGIYFLIFTDREIKYTAKVNLAR